MRPIWEICTRSGENFLGSHCYVIITSSLPHHYLIIMYFYICYYNIITSYEEKKIDLITYYYICFVMYYYICYFYIITCYNSNYGAISPFSCPAQMLELEATKLISQCTSRRSALQHYDIEPLQRVRDFFSSILELSELRLALIVWLRLAIFSHLSTDWQWIKKNPVHCSGTQDTLEKVIWLNLL